MSLLEGVNDGSGAQVNASTSGLNTRLEPSLSSLPPFDSKRGRLGRDSEEELDRRLGVEDFRRELPLICVEFVLLLPSVLSVSSGLVVVMVAPEVGEPRF